MDTKALGKNYQDGEIIVRQGEIGDCMYVVHEGFVEVFFESGDQEVQLRTLGKDEFFGEMAIFEHETRTATVRALGPVRLLTVDHKNLLQRIHEDPSLAYRLMEVMSKRIDKLSEEVARLNKKLSEYDGKHPKKQLVRGTTRVVIYGVAVSTLILRKNPTAIKLPRNANDSGCFYHSKQRTTRCGVTQNNSRFNNIG